MSKRIICDLDSIVVDMMTPWLEQYNAKFNDNVTEDSFLTWDMHKYCKAGKSIYSVINQPGFFRHLKMLPGAEAALKKLASDGHEILLVSAAVFPCNYPDKVEWCAEYLPFIDQKNVCIMQKKHLIPADIIIDDGPHNAEAYAKTHPHATVMSIKYLYNQDSPYYHVLADDYKNPAKAWEQIVTAVGLL